MTARTATNASRVFSTRVLLAACTRRAAPAVAFRRRADRGGTVMRPNYRSASAQRPHLPDVRPKCRVMRRGALAEPSRTTDAQTGRHACRPMAAKAVEPAIATMAHPQKVISSADKFGSSQLIRSLPSPACPQSSVGQSYQCRRSWRPDPTNTTKVIVAMKRRSSSF